MGEFVAEANREDPAHVLQAYVEAVPDARGTTPGGARNAKGRPVGRPRALLSQQYVELSEADAEKWLPLLLALKVPESVSAVNTTRTLAPGFQEARNIRQAQKRLTPEVSALIARKYEAGATAADLAAEFGCHPMTVTKAVKANGFAMRLTKITGERVDAIVGLYESGLSMEATASHVGVSAKTVFNYLHSRGIPTREVR